MGFYFLSKGFEEFIFFLFVVGIFRFFELVLVLVIFILVSFFFWVIERVATDLCSVLISVWRSFTFFVISWSFVW